jgi:hypothetical protein
MAQHHVIDYDSFLTRLVSGLRKAWQEVRSQRPDETLYLFGIATDSDITDLTPFCQTEEQYAAEGGDERAPIEKWAPDEEAELYRAGAQYTSDLADEVNRYVFEDHSDDPEGAFEGRKERLLQVFEKALQQLDAEGSFGTGHQRQQVLLMIGIVDADEDEEQYMWDAIKRMNPPESTGEFFRLLDEAEQEMEEEIGAESVLEQELIALATEYLRRKKCAFARCTGATQVPPEYWSQGRFAGLVPLLPQEPKPDALWAVAFDREAVPLGTSEASNVIIVLVDAETRSCATEPRQ